MDSLFKNSILFISGFIVAVVVYKSPVIVKNVSGKAASDYSSNTGIESAPSDLSKRPRFADVTNSNLSSRNLTKSNKFQANYNNSNGRPDFTSVPDIAGRSDDQVPTAPPTGRPTPDQALDEQNAKLEEENKAQDLAQKNANANSNIPQDKKSSKYENSNEQSLSSVMPMVGFVGNNASSENKKEGEKASPSSGGGGGAVGGGGNRGGSGGKTPDENSELDILPEQFTTEGLQLARKQYASQELSEMEYLEYLTLGLESSDSSLSSGAINALATVKTRNAFLLQAQFASASGANASATSQAVAANYISTSDLRFLSQMIADGSSVELQSWAITSLDVVIRAGNMDFNNQQIRDILVNNISNNLVKLDSGHPRFALAQSISRDINNKLT